MVRNSNYGDGSVWQPLAINGCDNENDHSWLLHWLFIVMIFDIIVVDGFEWLVSL